MMNEVSEWARQKRRQYNAAKYLTFDEYMEWWEVYQGLGGSPARFNELEAKINIKYKQEHSNEESSAF